MAVPNFMKIFLLALLLLSSIEAAQKADFVNFKTELVKLYDSSPRMIPLIVRLAYHDLLHQRAASGHGCLAKASFQNLIGNGGLSVAIQQLNMILSSKKLKNANFHFGDVIAFAGKIAVEKAYPCIHIPFKFNRNDCDQDVPLITLASSVQDSRISSPSSLAAHAQYLQLSVFELAVLTIGGHAIKGSAAHSGISGWNGVFSTVSSGREYILASLSRTWSAIKVNGLPAFVSGEIIRLPVDLSFFPSAPKSNNLFKRQEKTFRIPPVLPFFTKFLGEKTCCINS